MIIPQKIKNIYIRFEVGNKYYQKNETFFETQKNIFYFINGKKIEIRPIYLRLPIVYTEGTRNYDSYIHLF